VNLMLPGMYVAADSVVHRLDPRVKMGAATLLMVLPFAAPGLPGNLILSAFVIAVAALARVPMLAMLRTLRTVIWLGFFMFFFYAFTIPGGPTLIDWGWLSISWAGLLAGAAQIYRLCLLVIVAALMSYTTSPSQLAHGLEALLKPLGRVGLPVRELAMVVTIALRFVPTLADEIDKLSKAQRARGVDPGSAPWDRAKSWVPMFVPIFVSAFRRADSLATAMEARGFRGARHRTRLYQLELRRADLAAALIVLALTLVVLASTHLVG
jgi:energy-coupling factor transport system permease protein